MKHRLTALAAAAAVAFGFCGDLLPALNAADYTVFAAEIVDSGTCGTNLTWTLDSEGTLTVSGTGDMEYGTAFDSVPWSALLDDIKNAVIENGVTSIGSNAFYHCVNLSSVTLPDSITVIEYNAFLGCTGLTGITIPNSVTKIRDSAFFDCTSLTNITVDQNNQSFCDEDGILFSKDKTLLYLYPAGKQEATYTIPGSVTSTAYSAFRGCAKLISVTIPDSVTEIREKYFQGCNSLTNITVDQNNPSYCDEGGILFSKDKAALYCYPKGKQEAAYTIPDSVTSIGWNAFEGCTGLTSVTIPDSVTNIADSAFSFCTALADITVLNPECEIYDYSRTISDTAVIHGYAGSTAQAYAEKYGRTFEAIEAEPTEIIASGSRSNLSWTLDSAGTLTLSGSGSMPIVYTDWREHKDEIRKAVVSDGFTDLVENAFSGCTNLRQIQLPDSLKTIHRNAFTGTAWLAAKRAENPLVTVGGILVDGAAASGAVVIPESVSSIAEYAFSGNAAMTSVTLPETVTAVSSNAFNGCTALASVTLPEGVLSVGGYAFTKCTALKTLDIPASLTSFDAAAVSGCTALSAVNVSADNVMFMSEDGILYNKSKSTLMLFPPDKAEPYTFPDSVRNVSSNAFAENQHLTEITVPAGVKLNGSNIFRNCKNLTKAVLPDDLTDLQSGLFSGCSALTSVNIPAGVTQILWRPFDGCTSLAELTIPETVTVLGTFWNCCAPDARITILNKNCDLSGFQVQQGVTLGGYPYSTAYDFANANGITFEALASDLPEDVIDTGTCGDSLTWTLYTDGKLEISGTGWMEDYENRYSYSPDPKKAPWYARRDHITSVSLPNGLTGIGCGAFAECANLESVQIPSSMREIRPDAFAGCTALTAVKLPDSVGTIGEGAFRGCTSLESVTLPKGLYELGRYAFAECESLTSVKIPGGLENLYDSVFTGCTSLSKFTVDTENRSYVAVGGVLFSKAMDVLYYYPPAKSGTAYQVPKTVRIIREQAFAYCENLTEIQLPDILDWLGDGAFLGCSGLETAELPDSLTEYIGAGIFEGCTALTEVRLPAVIAAIPENMFADCVSLTAMDLPESVTAVGRCAFSGCASLETVTFRNPAFDFGKFREALESYNGYINQFAVSGYTGSTAEAYASSSGRTFIPLDSPAVTTTTTAAVTTTTTTTTAVTTTTLTTAATTTTAVTTTEPAKQEPFRYGLDEWGFINDRDLLGVRDGKKYSYYLSDEDYNTMMSMLSDTEKEQIRKRMESPVYGYCYGMSVSSILGYYGAFRPSDLVSSTSHLAEIDKDNISDAVRSAVNYYQLMQYTKAIAQVTRATEGAADEKKLKPLIEALDAGKPAVLGYVYQGQGDNKIGHAVVAYDISHEAGSIPISNTENFVFDVCIRIYDNQAPSYQSHSQDLYINTNKWLWCIPMTDNPSEYSKLAVMNHSAHHSGSVTLVLTEPEIMNCCGLFGGKKPDSDDPNFKYDRACIRYVPLNGLSNHGALEKSPDGTLNAAAGSGNIRFSADMNADETIDERLAYIDSDVGFYLTPGTAQAMSMSMEYEHYLMSAKADQSEKMLFTPDAEIECKNTSGAYEMEMVIDREARGIDWHKITVSGRNGGNIRMQLESDGKGFILSGDSLKNVAVRANTYENEAKRTFTADYGSVRIYEIDEKTIGIAADTDGDGVYETEIPADTERQKGDADGDGAVTNKDAQTVLVAYTDSLGTGIVDLPEAAFKAADVDGDGKVGAGDAQYILIYYTVNTIAGKPTAWEELISQ